MKQISAMITGKWPFIIGYGHLFISLLQIKYVKTGARLVSLG